MEKIWLRQYPKGVNSEINPERYHSITDLFEESVKKFSDTPAFINLGREISFSELDQLSAAFASFLQNKAGLKKGDRIAIQMPNVLQYPIVQYGAIRAGLIVVNTNPLYTSREMKHQFQDSGVKAIVILANCAAHLEEILHETQIETVVVTQVGDMLGFPKSFIVNAAVKYIKKLVPAYHLPEAYSFYETLDLGSQTAFTPVKSEPEDIAFLQYTGGTTGISKGAMLTHRNIISNMMQIVEWMKPLLSPGKEVAVLALPLYHIFSLTVNALGMLYFGATNLMITNPRDIPTFIKTLKKNRFTIFPGLNTLFNALMNNPDFDSVDWSELKICVAGGMALQKTVAENWMNRTKSLLVEGYGLTETSPLACCNPIDGTHKIGTIGIPVPSTNLTLRNDDGVEVKLGERGEIWIQGPQVMPGYWQNQNETDQILTPDGWIKTGDVGVMDPDGFVKIVDRKKDMIIVSGFNVYPNEIEEVVASHPKVLEVAAVGIFDARSAEAVKIFVVKKDPSLTQEELHAFCKHELTGYKQPKEIEFRNELPKTNVGKILRRALRDEERAKKAQSA
jgi:long-chain acyl-CoA synthetase